MQTKRGGHCDRLSQFKLLLAHVLQRQNHTTLSL